MARNKGIQQRQICVKVDYITMGALDTECFNTGEKRNRLINEAIRLLIELRDARRRGATTMEGEKRSVQRRLDDFWLAHWHAIDHGQAGSGSLSSVLEA